MELLHLIIAAVRKLCNRLRLWSLGPSGTRAVKSLDQPVKPGPGRPVTNRRANTSDPQKAKPAPSTQAEPQEPGRNAKGEYLPGHSGNPGGRPPGSRNRATVLLDQLGDGEGPELARMVIDQAKGGSILALKMVLPYVCSPGPGRRVELELPEIDDMAGVEEALMKVVQAAAQSRITLEEAESLTRMIKAQSEILLRSEKLDRGCL